MIPYGVYRNAGVAWLVQDSGSVNAIGLAERCPFPKPYQPLCPHDIRLGGKPDGATLDQLELLRRDPVARFFLPQITPPSEKVKVRFVVNADHDLPLYLQSLWSPTPNQNRITYISAASAADVRAKDNRTNIIPLVYMRCSVEHQQKIDRVLNYPLKNRAILFGDESVILPKWSAERVEASSLSVDILNRMDLNKIGAAALRQFMRGE